MFFTCKQLFQVSGEELRKPLDVKAAKKLFKREFKTEVKPGQQKRKKAPSSTTESESGLSTSYQTHGALSTALLSPHTQVNPIKNKCSFIASVIFSSFSLIFSVGIRLQ